MEQINLKTHISSNNLANFMDITKGLTSNLKQSKNSLNFKDYVKTNNQTAKNENTKKEENKYEINQNDRAKNVDMKQNSTKKEDSIKAPEKKNNISAKDTLKENETKINKEDKNNLESIDIKTENITNESKNEESKEDKDIENLALIQNALINIIDLKNDEIKLEEEIEGLSKSEIGNIIGEIDENNLIPQNIKEDLKDLFTKIEKFQEDSKKLDLNKALNEEDIKKVIELKEIFKEIEPNKEEQFNDNFNLNLSQEIDVLKSDFNKSPISNQTVSLNNQNVLQEKFLENNKESDSIFTGEFLDTNMKFGGFNAKIFTNIKSAMPNNNIQNFSKIVDEMRIAFKDDKTTINIKLEPENLGKLSVKINSENGVFNASFFVESDKTKQIVEQQIQNLKQALSNQGINIQDINVQVGQNNEDLNYHKNLMEAVNFSKRNSINTTEEEFEEVVNPYLKEDLFNDLI